MEPVVEYEAFEYTLERGVWGVVRLIFWHVGSIMTLALHAAGYVSIASLFHYLRAIANCLLYFFFPPAVVKRELLLGCRLTVKARRSYTVYKTVLCVPYVDSSYLSCIASAILHSSKEPIHRGASARSSALVGFISALAITDEICIAKAVWLRAMCATRTAGLSHIRRQSVCSRRVAWLFRADCVVGVGFAQLSAFDTLARRAPQ